MCCVVQNLLEEGMRRLNEITRDRSKYQEILIKLVTQALYQLMEKEVVIRCRQQDEALLQPEQINKAVAAYRQTTKLDCVVILDKSNYLPPEICGGIEASAQKGKIKVNNTLEKRLQQIYSQVSYPLPISELVLLSCISLSLLNIPGISYYKHCVPR
ncbi:ATP6V1E1 [Cordylochernes scorpioides]|uniref:ATP6V1E1 n=1 Tax=Cordylochernes scorpioides TaxID=51811 RepID=A0ABY6LHR1_9ARAC|nr:ATP6V1E1 [Cordylochernes scorpioides]